LQKRNPVEKSVSEFYDAYSAQQIKTGVHIRHYSILSKLKKAGLKPDSIVLEVGCGVGTLTGLLAKYLSSGKITATDISSESIEAAKKEYSKYTNLSFVVTDMSDFVPSEKLDFVIFPDVLEHIPKEQHNAIFRNIAPLLKQDAKVAVHIPDPLNLDYIRKNTPELLQIIDQSLYLEDFAKAIEGTDLMIDLYERYPLFNVDPDYDWLVFSKKVAYKHAKKQSKAVLKLKELSLKHIS
jgi:trans-aconitate 2-methyltransferase